MTPAILHRIRFTGSFKIDWQENINHILTHFKYHEYAIAFTSRIYKAVEKLKIFPTAYPKTDFTLNGHPIYLKPVNNYLLFFVVIQESIYLIRVLNERVHWQNYLKRITNIEL